jgi:hypothetical protein
VSCADDPRLSGPCLRTVVRHCCRQEEGGADLAVVPWVAALAPRETDVPVQVSAGCSVVETVARGGGG